MIHQDTGVSSLKHTVDKRRINATSVSFCKNPPVNNVLKIHQNSTTYHDTYSRKKNT